jgi:PST family polysaccharide transporter
MTEGSGPNTSHRTATGAVWIVAGRMIARCVDLFSLLVLARLLSPAEFGTVAVAMTLIYIVEAVLELPVGQALTRLPFLETAHLDTAFTLSAARGLLLGVILVALAWPYAMFNHDTRLAPLITVLALAPIMRSLASPAMVNFTRNLDFRRDFLMDIASRTSSAVVAISVAYLTKSYWALAAGTLAGPLTLIIGSFIFAPYRPTFSLLHWPVFSSLVRWNLISQIANSLSWQFDRLLLGRLAPHSEVGQYSVASDLASAPMQMFIMPIFKPLVVSLAKLNEDLSRQREAFARAFAVLFTVGAPLFVGIALLANPVVQLALGPKWPNAGLYLSILALANLPQVVLPLCTSLLFARDRLELGALLSVVCLAFKAPTTIIGIIYFGMPGILAAQLISSVFVLAAVMGVTRYELEYPMRAQLLLAAKPLIACAVMAASLHVAYPYLISTTSNVNLFFGVVAMVALGGLIYAGALFALWSLTGRRSGAEAFLLHWVASHVISLRQRLRGTKKNDIPEPGV